MNKNFLVRDGLHDSKFEEKKENLCIFSNKVLGMGLIAAWYVSFLRLPTKNSIRSTTKSPLRLVNY